MKAYVYCFCHRALETSSLLIFSLLHVYSRHRVNSEEWLELRERCLGSALGHSSSGVPPCSSVGHFSTPCLWSRSAYVVSALANQTLITGWHSALSVGFTVESVLGQTGSKENTSTSEWMYAYVAFHILTIVEETLHFLTRVKVCSSKSTKVYIFKSTFMS